jgi:alkylation response protein AidB-like acyl-CoA dehydrogenase
MSWKFDHADEYPAEMVEQMKELGPVRRDHPQEYGGLGLSATTYAQLVEKPSRRSGCRSPASSTAT